MNLGALLPLQFIAAADMSQVYIVVGLLLGLALFLFIGSRSSTPSGPSGKVSIGGFRRQAKSAGLEKDQIKILEKAVKDQKIGNPVRLLTHAGLLNKVLRTLIDDVRQSSLGDSQKEALISEFFRIKTTLGNTRKVSSAPGSQIVGQGQTVTLYTRSKPPMESMVTANMESRLSLQVPKTPQGILVRYKVGEPIRVRFVRDTGKVFRFETKILEVTNVDGIDVILLEHVKQMEQVQLRRYPRKEINKPTYFQKVEILTEGKGRKEVKRAVVQKNRRFLGQVEDVSVGGCAIFSRTLLEKNTLVKITFDIGPQQTVNAFGKILHSRSRRPQGGIMHVAFTRVSKQNLNQIQSFIYGITGPDEY
ncbi:MAG: PilZ domain-containing protein [Spirochaetales bacterium]|nr:PilZ domain-containing protein [Spirochaetales bacterium]